MVVFQSIWGQLLDAVVLGVIFARISYPKQRARTIFISDSAVIARRDSQLKFMFRIGDIRQSTVRGTFRTKTSWATGFEPARLAAERFERSSLTTWIYPLDPNANFLMPRSCPHASLAACTCGAMDTRQRRASTFLSAWKPLSSPTRST